jgi:hypothetical protein
MNANQWIAGASVAAVIVSALAIVTALKGVGNQLRVTVFVAYTERYAKVMMRFPSRLASPAAVIGWRLGRTTNEFRCWEPIVTISISAQRRCGSTNSVESTAPHGASGSKACGRLRDSHHSGRLGGYLPLNTSIMAISNSSLKKRCSRMRIKTRRKGNVRSLRRQQCQRRHAQMPMIGCSYSAERRYRKR